MEGITASRLREDDIDDLVKTPNCDSFALSAREREVLKLWDQLEDLRLEQTLLEARNDVPPPDHYTVPDDQLDVQAEIAQNEALEARASYVLRNRIVQHTVITDPVLKSVHQGANGDQLSQRLLALVNERDVLSMVNSKLSRDGQAASSEVIDLEKQTVSLSTTNQGLATAMLGLAESAKEQKADEVDDHALRNELLRLDHEVKTARRDWRIMKSVVSAIVAGSGVDWAKDEALTEMVLDDEE